MNSSPKKIQAFLCLIAGVGLFLPLIKVTAYGDSVSATFMEIFDTGNASSIEGLINGKIVIGVLVLAFIMLLVRFKVDGFPYKIGSLVLVIAAGVLFYIDVDKLNAAKSILSSMMKYGIGYYLSLLSLIVAIILGVIDIFNEGNNSRSGYPADFDMVINKHYDGQNPVNNSGTYNIVNGNNMTNPQYNQNNVVNQQTNPNPVPQTNNNQMKLSDLVSNSVINQENTNNNNNINNN